MTIGITEQLTIYFNLSKACSISAEEIFSPDLLIIFLALSTK